jgi:hypothetical protein
MPSASFADPEKKISSSPSVQTKHSFQVGVTKKNNLPRATYFMLQTTFALRPDLQKY